MYAYTQIDEARLLDRLDLAVQPLCEHAEFINQILEAVADILPNDMVSYNEIPDVNVDNIGTWDIEALLQSTHAVWSPAASTAGFSVNDQLQLLLRYFGEHPVLYRRKQILFRNSELVAQDRWHRTNLYNELFRPLGIDFQCNLVFPALPGRIVSIAYNREHDDFSDGEMHWLARVQNSLSRLFRDHWRYLELVYERDQWRRMSERDDQGVVYLTGHGAVLWAGHQARARLRQYGLSLVHGELPTPLITWLVPVIRGRAVTVQPLSRTSEGKTLTIRYHPNEIGCTGGMLRLYEKTTSLVLDSRQVDAKYIMSVITDTFALTPRQAQVALWMSRGKSNQEIAVILGIRPATAKKHSEKILAKLRVENRASAASTIYEAIMRSG